MKILYFLDLPLYICIVYHINLHFLTINILLNLSFIMYTHFVEFTITLLSFLLE
jgi:hypothetical protein